VGSGERCFEGPGDRSVISTEGDCEPSRAVEGGGLNGVASGSGGGRTK